MFYLGWVEYLDNSLEVISGMIFRGELLGRYFVINMMIGQWLSLGFGLYIRLRGVILCEDRFNFIFMVVDNVIDGELYNIFCFYFRKRIMIYLIEKEYFFLFN